MEKSYLIVIHIFAGVGLLFSGMFVAIRMQWTDVAGAVDGGSSAFEEQQKILDGFAADGAPEKTGETPISLDGMNQQIRSLEKNRDLAMRNLCAAGTLADFSPSQAGHIVETGRRFSSEPLKAKIIFASVSALGKEREFSARVEECLAMNGWERISEDVIIAHAKEGMSRATTIFQWADQEEWLSIVSAVRKDHDAIFEASRAAQIEPRLLVANLVVEQLRLFHSQRELFKKFFGPLKILGNANKISLGVMGIKEATAAQIETHLKDPSSSYYLGSEFGHLLDYAGEATGEARYARLVSEERNHHYSYLYGALYMKQLLTQWERAGYPVEYRPEISGTLYNIGFPQSRPNPHPQVGGSKIQIGERTYSFGRLAYEFYYSDELLDEFPYEVR